MKRAKYLLFLLVLTAAVFGLAAVASAAVFSDIQGKPSASAIMRLAAQGVIDGYPDGTFRPDNTITRAEFCKFAVIAAGLKDVASGYENVPSPFADVPTGAWYTGWVNIAAAQGYVKGYPDGTFKPDAQITQQEVITVLMRLLGYNDNLPGDWPFDYLAKAAKLGVTEDITVRAAMPATRGEVAILTDATLDENIVDYDAEKNVFTEKLRNGQPITLRADSFKDSVLVKDQVVTNFDLHDNKLRLVLTNGDTVELAKDYTLYGVANFPALLDRVVDYIIYYDKTDDKWYANYVEAKYDVQTADEVKVTTNSSGKLTRIEINGKSYEVAANATFVGTGRQVGASWDGNSITTAGVVYRSDGTTVWANASSEKLDADQLYKVTIDKDGKAVRIKFLNWRQAAVVDSVDADRKVVRLKQDGKRYGYSATRLDLSDKDGQYYVFKNGKLAGLSDLKENDLVFNYGRGVQYLFDATDKKAQGRLTAYQVSDSNADVATKIQVGDKWYELAENATYSTDGGTDFDGDLTVARNIDKDLIDQDVEVRLNPAGQVQLLITSTKAAGNKIYGVVTEVIRQAASASGVTDYIKVLKADGTEASYEINKDSSDEAKAFRNAYAASEQDVDVFVEFTVTSAGVVDSFDDLTDGVVPGGSVWTRATMTDVDTGRMQVNGSTWLQVADDVVVFSLRTEGDTYASVVKYRDLYDAVDGGQDVQIAYYSSGADGLVDYIVVMATEDIATKDFYMVMDKGRDADGWWLKVDRAGQATTYKVSGTPTGWSRVTKGDVIKLTFSAGKISAVDYTNGFDFTGVENVNSTVSSAVYVKEVKSGENRVRIVDTKGTADPADDTDNWYLVDSDTIIYDIDETDPMPMTLRDVGKDDAVRFYADKGVIKWMVVNN